MFNSETILNELIKRKLLLFKEPISENIDVISDEIKGTSITGQYFNSATHPYLKSFNNILSYLPLIDDVVYQVYDVSITFSKGEYTYESGVIFKSKRDSNLNNPTTDVNYWEKTSITVSTANYELTTTYSTNNRVYDGSKYYLSLVDSNLGNALTNPAFWKETTMETISLLRTIEGSINTLITETLKPAPIIDYADYYNVSTAENLITNEGKQVGFVIYQKGSENLSIRINSLQTQFDTSSAPGDLVMLGSIYNETELVYEISIPLLVADSGKMITIDLTNENIELKGKKGNWYFIYNQSLLEGNNIKAYGDDIIAYNESEYFTLSPIKMDSISDLADSDNIDSDYSKSFGLGFNVSVSPDYTQFVLDNLYHFVEGIRMQWSLDFLNDMFHNTNVRSNRTERNVDVELLTFDLKGTDGNPFWRSVWKSKKRLSSQLNAFQVKDDSFKKPEQNNFEVW